MVGKIRKRKVVRSYVRIMTLRGPKMHLWIKKISARLDCHLRTGGRDTDEWIWETMINDFAQNFQDVMSWERAEKKLFKLKME